MRAWLQVLVVVTLLAATSFRSLGGSFEKAIEGASHDGVHELELVLTSRSQAGAGNFMGKAQRLIADVTHVLGGRGAPAPSALFDASSITWELGQRRALLFGGQRAVLMQVADPAVAAGVLDFSSFRKDSLGRLKRTMEAMNVIQYGSAEESQKLLTRLERMHRRVKGTTPGGNAYSAMNPDLQYWVLATLVDSALEVERRFVGRFDNADRAKYFESSKKLAHAFGLDDEHIPADYAAFERYMARRVADLQPTEQSKEVAAALFRPAVPLVPKFAFAPLEWVTRDMMPRVMARRYGFRGLNPIQKALVRGGQQLALLFSDTKLAVSQLHFSKLAVDRPRLRP